MRRAMAKRRSARSEPLTGRAARILGWMALLLGVAAIPAGPAAAGDDGNGGGKVVYSIDFTGQSSGKAVDWLEKQGFELRLKARALDPRFTDKGLMLSTDGRVAGLFARKLELPRADRIRVVWGVERYPEGANWNEGVYRVPIAVMVSFGEEEIESGSFFVPDAPYFISLFLSKNADPGRSYVANYYHEGGRYFCVPCSAPVGETVTTEFDLVEAFRKEFDQTPVPPITSFSFQMNTEDTQGGARAYLSKVEFLVDAED